MRIIKCAPKEQQKLYQKTIQLTKNENLKKFWKQKISQKNKVYSLWTDWIEEYNSFNPELKAHESSHFFTTT